MKRRLLTISCSTPVLILTIMAHQLGGQKNHPVILMGTALHPLTQQMYGIGMCEIEGREQVFGEKTRSAESRKARKRWQNYRQQMRKLSF